MRVDCRKDGSSQDRPSHFRSWKIAWMNLSRERPLSMSSILQKKIVAAFIGRDRGIGVAQMQKAGWTGREPCDNHWTYFSGRAEFPRALVAV